jgi:U4/U6 small nuclear ribonucleoprotein PRP4
MTLRSHIKPILALDWSPNGYQLVTGGEDNTLKIWDIRAKACIYTVPAHTNLVSQVRYWHATDAFDSGSKFKDWTWTNQSANNDMDVDTGSGENYGYGSRMRREMLDGSFLVSCSYDGTCKLWSDGDYKPLKSLSGVEGKVMCTDISGGTLDNIDGKYVATALYDRTFKLYYSPSV